MSIDWLEAESAIDERESLRREREVLEAKLDENIDDAETALALLEVMDKLELDPIVMTEAVRETVSRNEDNAALLAWVGQLAYRVGEMRVSALTLKQAQSIDDSQPLIHFTMGQMLMQAGQFEKCLEHADKALANADGVSYHAQIIRLKCISLARLRRYDAAWELQKARLDEEPDNSEVITDSADLLDIMGRSDESKELLAKALERRPSDTDILMRVAMNAHNAGDLTDCRDRCDRILAIDSQHLEAWNLRAETRFKLGDYSGALNDHDMIAELSKSIPLDQAFRASCLLKMNRQDDAIAALRTGIEESKNWPDRKQHYQKMLNELTVQTPDKQRQGSKLSPNDPCWCGSGRKLKKCHGL